MSDSAGDRPSSPPGKLNLTTRLAFGIGDLGTAITAGILLFYQFAFFTKVAGLSPGLAGVVRTIATVWDGVNDPLVGMWSDRTQTRWGRRYPWMLAGAIPLGLFFFLQWVVPQFSDNPARQQTSLFWFYVVISVVFNMAYTAVNLPYTALTAELTRDYDERTSLTQFRFMFSIGGSILALVLALGVFSFVQNPLQQYLFLGAICGLISIFPTFLSVWGTYRRATEMGLQNTAVGSAEAIPYLRQMQIAFSNRPFLFVIGIYLFSQLAVQNTAGIIPFFISDLMQLPDQHLALGPLAIQGTAVLMLPVWNAVSRRVGKKAAYLMGMSCWVIAAIAIFQLQPGQVGWMYFWAILAGFGVSTAYLIPWSMLPDVIELDELQTGQRREGVFYGFMVFLQKSGLFFAQLLAGFSLEWSGFTADATRQPDSAILTIRWLMGLIPAIALILGMVLAYFYPISREVHAEILLKLKEREEREEG